jgi:hypothetical protein
LPLFGLLWPLRFAQPHSRAAAVLVDELNTDRLSSGFRPVRSRLDPHQDRDIAHQRTRRLFKAANRSRPYVCGFCQVLSPPTQ